MHGHFYNCSSYVRLSDKEVQALLENGHSKTELCGHRDHTEFDPHFELCTMY